MKLSSSTSLIRMILKHAFDSSADPQTLLHVTGINSETLENSDARISGDRVYALWKQAEEHTQDPNFGLHLGESMQGNPGGNLLFSLMTNSPTVGDALKKFCRYHRIMNDAIQPVLEEKANLAYLSWKIKTKWPGSSRHLSEALLCIFQSILNHLTGHRFIPVEVRFRHKSPDDISIHQKIFPTSIRFSQDKDELVMKKKLLEEEIFLADQRLLETLERHALDLTNRIDSPDSWTVRVIQSINKNLQGQKPTIKLIARDIAISVRSLQSKLRDEETSFQTLLDIVRKDKALQYLKNQGMTLVDIAFILGFSEQSAFNHAFKRWTNKTPKQFQQSKDL